MYCGCTKKWGLDHSCPFCREKVVDKKGTIEDSNKELIKKIMKLWSD